MIADSSTALPIPPTLISTVIVAQSQNTLYPNSKLPLPMSRSACLSQGLPHNQLPFAWDGVYLEVSLLHKVLHISPEEKVKWFRARLQVLEFAKHSIIIDLATGGLKSRTYSLTSKKLRSDSVRHFLLGTCEEPCVCRGNSICQACKACMANITPDMLART